MPDATSTLEKFLTYVWEELPLRRQVLGSEVVADIVLIAIQHWPVENLSCAEPGSPEEAELLNLVGKDVTRIMCFVWGPKRFRAIVGLGFFDMLPAVLSVMTYWWRDKKSHRGRMNNWRRRWMAEE